MNENELVRICALLHDIGKPLCWAKQEPWSKHVEVGYGILKESFGEDIALCAVRHHNSGYYHEYYHPQTSMEKVISISDHIASGSDRSSSEHPDYYSSKPSLPVVFTHVLSNDRPLRSINADELIGFTNDLILRFKGREPNVASLLNYLGSSILTAIPADTRFSDVSLYDHLRLTAAIANCIWRQGYRTHEPEYYRFALISADADRISSYINYSYRLPDLHAGSTTISEATKSAADVVRNHMGEECVIFEGGGSVLAISTENLAGQICREMEQVFLDATSNEVSLTVSAINTNGKDLQQDFGKLWQKAMQNIRLKKIERMESPPEAISEDVQVCEVCRKRPATILDERRATVINTVLSFDSLCSICKERRDRGGSRSIDVIATRDPNNLIAVIRADGDGMGDVLSGKRLHEFGKGTTPGRIATISRTIDNITKRFRKLIDSHGGETIFAGGDDLLAITPAYVSLDLVYRMSREFEDEMGGGATISAGVTILDYKLPIYVALEHSAELLKKAKRTAKKASISFDVMTSLEKDNNSDVKAYSWSEFKELLDAVEYLKSGRIEMSQLRRIASSLERPVEAEILIKYNMGRESSYKAAVIEWNVGEKLLQFLHSQKLRDAFIIYNLLRDRGDN